MKKDRGVRSSWRKGLTITGGVLAALIGLGWVGLQLQPGPFPALPHKSPPLDTIAVPAGLPAPVERFYRQTYGERVPVVESAVITGRGTMRLFGITFPARFRFTHDVGRSYRHYFELTVLGLPIMKVNEYYVDGKERMELPMGIQENNPKLDQGGNLGMWAELLKWVPAGLLTDERVRWEAIDNDTAFLVVPFEGRGEERFVVRFDPATSKVMYFEVMRYQNGEGDKALWINGAWFDEGSPWAVFDSEDITYNVDVKTSVDAKGP